ncbi:hypothetical protein HK096_004668, partial [Nowakowskiella sp. JEL0078]
MSRRHSLQPTPSTPTSPKPRSHISLQKLSEKHPPSRNKPTSTLALKTAELIKATHMISDALLSFNPAVALAPPMTECATQTADLQLSDTDKGKSLNHGNCSSVFGDVSWNRKDVAKEKPEHAEQTEKSSEMPINAFHTQYKSQTKDVQTVPNHIASPADSTTGTNQKLVDRYPCSQISESQPQISNQPESHNQQLHSNVVPIATSYHNIDSHQYTHTMAVPTRPTTSNLIMPSLDTTRHIARLTLENQSLDSQNRIILQELQNLQSQHNQTILDLQNVQSQHNQSKLDLQCLQTQHNQTLTEIQCLQSKYRKSKLDYQNLQSNLDSKGDLQTQNRDLARRELCKLCISEPLLSENLIPILESCTEPATVVSCARAALQVLAAVDDRITSLKVDSKNLCLQADRTVTRLRTSLENARHKLDFKENEKRETLERLEALWTSRLSDLEQVWDCKLVLADSKLKAVHEKLGALQQALENERGKCGELELRLKEAPKSEYGCNSQKNANEELLWLLKASKIEVTESENEYLEKIQKLTNENKEYKKHETHLEHQIQEWKQEYENLKKILDSTANTGIKDQDSLEQISNLKNHIVSLESDVEDERLAVRKAEEKIKFLVEDIQKLKAELEKKDMEFEANSKSDTAMELINELEAGIRQKVGMLKDPDTPFADLAGVFREGFTKRKATTKDCVDVRGLEAFMPFLQDETSGHLTQLHSMIEETLSQSKACAQENAVLHQTIQTLTTRHKSRETSYLQKFKTLRTASEAIEREYMCSKATLLDYEKQFQSVLASLRAASPLSSLVTDDFIVDQKHPYPFLPLVAHIDANHRLAAEQLQTLKSRFQETATKLEEQSSKVATLVEQYTETSSRLHDAERNASDSLKHLEEANRRVVAAEQAKRSAE